jgi:predicted  nucleic acid-binding Zn-ribbon protein
MDTRQQVEDWLQHSRRIVEVLPDVLNERDELMRRTLSAEDEVVRLGERNAALRDELASTRSQHESLLRRHTEIAENIGRAIAHVRQVFEEPVKKALGGERESGDS